MRVTPPLLALMVVAAPGLTGQVVGDSIRLRIPPSKTWTYGRIVSLDSSQLILSQAESTQSYPLTNIGRVEVRRRKNPGLTVLADVLASAAGASVAIVARPANSRSVFGSDGAAVAVSAGVGLAVGLIELGASPWHWKRVHIGIDGRPLNLRAITTP